MLGHIYDWGKRVDWREVRPELASKLRCMTGSWRDICCWAFAVSFSARFPHLHLAIGVLRLLLLSPVLLVVKILHAQRTFQRSPEQFVLPNKVRVGRPTGQAEVVFERTVGNELQAAREHSVVPADADELHDVGVPEVLHEEALEAGGGGIGVNTGAAV